MRGFFGLTGRLYSTTPELGLKSKDRLWAYFSRVALGACLVILIPPAKPFFGGRANFSSLVQTREEKEGKEKLLHKGDGSSVNSQEVNSAIGGSISEKSG